MNIVRMIQTIFSLCSSWFWKKSLLVKIIIILLIIGASWLLTQKFKGTTGQTIYQTAPAEKGTLVVSVTASGQVSATRNASITTEASGVVNTVYVKDGDTVKSGNKIAEIDLDLEGKQRAAQALSSYQSAKNNEDSQQANFYSLQSTMLTDWKSFMDIAQSSTYQNSDGSPKNDTRQLPQFMSTNDDWLYAEAKYKNQQAVFSQAQTALNSAWMSYQKTSPIIYAPISGTVTGLSLQIGSVIVAQSTSTGATSGQKIANIKTTAPPTITINLTEIDVSKVKVGNKATVTVDSFPGKTFTGEAISIDTVGTVSSGVTNYPVVIKLDTDGQEILSNMSASASIITQTKDNILTVPVSAVKTQNGQSTVQIMKNGTPQSVNVETGLSSDTQIEIVSGVAENDTVVTSVVTTGTTPTQTQSVFSSFGAGRGFGGGGRVGR